MSIEDGNVQELTQNSVAFSRPAWSPDGTQIIYDSVGDIHIYDIASQTSEPITDSNFWLQRPMWSPDGTRIAYEAYLGRNTTLFQVDLSTGEETQLSPSDRTDRHITWTNDPNQIVFQSTRLFPGRLYSLMLDQPMHISEIAIPPLSGSPTLSALWSSRCARTRLDRHSRTRLGTLTYFCVRLSNDSNHPIVMKKTLII